MSEAYARIKVVREPKAPSGHNVAFLGPFPSSSQAYLCKEALEEAFPIRRCTKTMGKTTRFAPCALADMGRCVAPCDGRVTLEGYGELVTGLVSSLSHPGGLLEALELKMQALAEADRFEEAANARDRLRALGEALARSRTDRWLLDAGRLVLRDADGRPLRFEHGALAEVGTGASPDANAEPIVEPVPRERADELTEVRRWLARNPVVIETSEHPVAEPVEGGAQLHRLLTSLRAATQPLDRGLSRRR
jgi:hypothetical protein